MDIPFIKKCKFSLGGLVAKSSPTLATPWTVACQAPLPRGFSRQECWSGLPFPSPGDLPNQESNLDVLHCRQILYWLSYEGSPSFPFTHRGFVKFGLDSFLDSFLPAIAEEPCWGSLVAQLVKNPPAMWETWVRFLGWEDPLEKGKATHPSILVWRIPWTIHGVAKSRTRLHFHHSEIYFCFWKTFKG